MSLLNYKKQSIFFMADVSTLQDAVNFFVLFVLFGYVLLFIYSIKINITNRFIFTDVPNRAYTPPRHTQLMLEN